MFGNLGFGDGDQIAMGQSSDLRIYHDGSNSYIDDAGYRNGFISGLIVHALANTLAKIPSSSMPMEMLSFSITTPKNLRPARLV